MQKINALCLALLIIVISTPLTAKTYRWVDENGNTVYSQHPPPSGDATEIKPPPPPAIAPEVAQSKLNQQKQQLEDLREDREIAKEAEEKDTAEKTRLDKNCAAAKKTLDILINRPRARWKTAEDYGYITGEKRQAKILKAKGQIKENCK
ncbi:hypothetical protein MNBD_GAMMA26-69 [hydrothermal vent metagenome]|uniref:DUF4124 domain-containing protein n=1 Tax=hydrothermal vent metagenome TaxID=652676 RepID=A0A3B1BHZ7_9ZZZZ